MKNFCQETLIKLINQHGHELTNDPNRVYAMLLDLCSQHTREVHVLSAVVKKGLVKELLRGNGKIPSAILIPKLANRLYDELGIDREIASWAVKVWSAALGLEKGCRENLYFDREFKEHTDNKKEKFTNEFGMEFVYIKPGKFMMGSPESEEGRFYDEVLHEVELTRGFYMMTTPVTRKMYEKITGNNPSYFKGCPDCPVEEVSWNDAQKFIIELNKKESSLVYFLPTEAQWEYCCRAGTTTAYSWGDSRDCSKANFGNGFSEECKGINPGKPTPVKSYPPNPWGIYDMHGNVWEWCLDWYGDYKKEAVVNPGGPGSGSSRVIRGGSWFSNARYCRSANRGSLSPGYSDYAIGFRLVVSRDVSQERNRT